VTGQPAVRTVVRDGILEVVIDRPVLALPVLDALAAALDRAELEAVPVILRSSHPSIFLAGAHLAEIATLDRHSARSYAHKGRSVIDRLTRLPAPVVAAVHGPCSGGGFDLVLASDEIVAGPGARFHHPGAVRGLVTGWGGTDRVPSRLGGSEARRALVLGRPIEAEQALRIGLVGMIADDPAFAAHDRVRMLASIHPRRLEMWRTLRHGRFVDRFRAVVVHP
jgi:enoyl-CoA hydratase